MQDSSRFPFSLFSASKQFPAERKIEKAGSVFEIYDKKIARTVIQVKGNVSANNYIEFTNLGLSGNYIYIMLQLHKNDVGTIHFAVETNEGLAIRITLSTLYDTVKFLVRSLRIPLPITKNWMIIEINISAVLNTYCVTATSSIPPIMKHIKAIQICSNLTVKDCVTSDAPLVNDPKLLPRMLTLKTSVDQVIEWVSIPHIQKSSQGTSPPTPVVVYKPVGVPSATTNTSPLINKADDGNLAVSINTMIAPYTRNTLMRSPSRDSEIVEKRLSKSADITKRQQQTMIITTTNTTTTIQAKTPSTSSRSILRSTSSKSGFISHNKETSVVSKTSTRKVSLSTPVVHSGAIFKHKLPETSERDKCLALNTILHYDGGKALLIDNGRMAVFSSGPIIILLDLDEKDEHSDKIAGNGLWSVFKQQQQQSQGGGQKQQAYLYGHTAPIVVLELSPTRKLLISGEKGPNGLLIMRNIVSGGGSKLACIRPHKEGVVCIAVNHSESMLCSVGYDANRHLQIIIFDLQALIRDKIGVTPSTPSKTCAVVAKQMSDFDVTRILFSPFIDDALISCGRENIRFWRIKRNHLPGRPLLLNEFSRGFIFTDICFVEPQRRIGDVTALPAEGTAFLASNKGVVLRVDCQKEQIVCAYQLHSGAITAMRIQGGFAITGGADRRLRIWPLDFSDFLLEAQHESAVISLADCGSGDSSSILVGLSAGILGLLDTTSHSFSALIRSHTNRINAVCYHGNEFVTLSADGTVRIWDMVSLEEKFEFASTGDEPICAAFHPRLKVMAAGFKSGVVRVFDLRATCVLYERRQSSTSCSHLLFNTEGSRLFVSSTDGILNTFDTNTAYTVIRSIPLLDSVGNTVSTTTAVPGNNDDDGPSTIYLALNFDCTLLACCSKKGNSLSIIDAVTLQVIFRVKVPSTTSGSPAFVTSGSGSKDIESSKSIQKSSASTKENLANVSVQASIGDIVGIFFMNQSSSIIDHLMVVTSKCIVNVPILIKQPQFSLASTGLNNMTTTMDEFSSPSSEKVSSYDILWGDRSIRRVDFGIPKSVTRDETGLIFMLIKAPETTQGGVVSINGSADAMAVFRIHPHKKDAYSNQYNFILSSEQLYQQTKGTGVLTGITASAVTNKVIVTDNIGAIFVYQIDPINVKKLDRKSTNLSSTTAFETPEDTSESFKFSYIDQLDTVKKVTIHNLTADFERAVEDNPHIWSSESTPVPKTTEVEDV